MPQKMDAEERMIKNILNGLSPDTKIYRVVNVDRFFELIEERKLILVKPHKWDDPFENLLSKTIAINSKGERIGFSITNDFFGQCWTLRKECDGIWRNYASLNNGVRLETTVRKLLSVLFNYESKWANIACFIGKVIYKTESEIKDNLADIITQCLFDTSGKNTAKTLLIKRKEFEYEKEVRLLYSNKEIAKHTDVLAIENIDIINLFDSFCFAPLMSNYLYNIYKEKMLQYNIPENAITKSKLYEPNTVTIKTDIL